MGKYIIELERGETAYKTVNSNGKPMIQLLAPMPYTEPDTEKVREEAYKNGYDAACKDIDIKSKTNAAYRKGLEDAWEYARKIANMPYGEEEKVFGSGGWAFIEKHTASEAIEKIRQYEQGKEEQIQVGDEVKGKYGTTAGMLGIVTRLDDALQNYNVVWSDGSTICFTGYRERGDVVKTGRHFPEIAEVLKKMKEAE